MTSLQPAPVAYPFNEGAGIGLSDAYAQAQEAPGMVRVQMPYGEPAWLAVRFADARFVLGDRRFSRAAASEHDAPRQSPLQRTGGILSMDPPEHSRLRKLVTTAFTVRRVEQLRPRVAELANGLLDDMIAAGPPADLVEDYALPIPVAVICEMLGVPVEDRARFRAWSDASLSTTSLTEQEQANSREELRDYMRGLIAKRRAKPEDDLMTALVQARDEEDRLTELELVDMCVGILVAGHETTASQIPNFVYVLLEHPQQLAQLRADESLLPKAVEELLRFVPLGSGAGFPRYAAEDIEVGGVRVKAGEPVVVAVGAANRDAAQFPGPGELSFDREGPHLGFGHGAHHCLGAQLARVELQEALRALLKRLPGLRPAGPVEWKTQLLVRGPKRMPITW